MNEKMDWNWPETDDVQKVSPEEEMASLEFQEQSQQMEKFLRRSWNMAEKLAADGFLEIAHTCEHQYFGQYALYQQLDEEHLYSGQEERCVPGVPYEANTATHKTIREIQEK